MSFTRKWLVRPLARFGRRWWISVCDLWPAGMEAPHARPKPAHPRGPMRLEGPMVLERRETPDGLLGILTSGVALGGVPLIAGQFVTPLVALFRGWNGNHAIPPAPTPVGQPYSLSDGPSGRPDLGRLVGLDRIDALRHTRDD